MARKLYECMRREAAAVKIQKNMRRHKARESYLQLQAAAITLQTGLRAMSARKEFRFRKETKAAVHIQVRDFQLSCYSNFRISTLIVSFFNYPYFISFNDHLIDMIF